MATKTPPFTTPPPRTTYSSSAKAKPGTSAPKTRILFVFPRWPARTLWVHFRYKFPALGLLTIAAITLDNYDIEFIDENCRDIPTHPNADIIIFNS
jgi:hypothetical protein